MRTHTHAHACEQKSTMPKATHMMRIIIIQHEDRHMQAHIYCSRHHETLEHQHHPVGHGKNSSKQLLTLEIRMQTSRRWRARYWTPRWSSRACNHIIPTGVGLRRQNVQTSRRSRSLERYIKTT